MKFTTQECLEKLPLSANEKWKDGVFDIEPFKKKNVIRKITVCQILSIIFTANH